MTNIQIIHTLRSALKSLQCDAMVLPVTDEYQGEYSAAYARRVEWLCGFDGSAGMLVILTDKAALLTDGRYTLQAAQQLDSALFEVVDSGKISTAEYLKANTSEGCILGYDPWLHTSRHIATLEKALSGHVTLRPLPSNPIDALWNDQPPRPCAPIFRHDDALAGRSSADKNADVVARMHKDAGTLLLTEPDAICWLLNIRGGDVPFNPLPLCYVVVFRTGEVALIIDPAKVPKDVLEAHVHVVDEVELATRLPALVGASLQYDPATCPIWFVQHVQAAGITLHEADNPVTSLRSIKNPIEQHNIRRAHQVDGEAMQKFLTWLAALPQEKTITELEIIDTLEAFRREHPDYRGASFATIAGAGEHGAIVHYRATSDTNRAWAVGEALLVDSGGQYPYGTTDITRTVFRGTPPAAFKHHFTLVLKGHIALARAVFPEGTTGHQLDALARQYLWQHALDYAHGTGHGVGHYLCVHEGPQNISTRANGVALKAGMILSNEPGYYATDAYGIRIESLVLVVEKYVSDAGTRFLGFETLTRAPIDARLVDTTLMREDEMEWLEAYNAWSVQ
jgi:Xaa-Pro aminopeptidase